MRGKQGADLGRELLIASALHGDEAFPFCLGRCDCRVENLERKLLAFWSHSVRPTGRS
jgi:hypothetical protein